MYTTHLEMKYILNYTLKNEKVKFRIRDLVMAI